MQRDMDFTRDILRKIEENPEADRRHDIPYSTPDEMGIAGHTSEELVYHLELLLDAEFIKADASILPVIVQGLTWKGHEFLANIKNDDIWSLTKKQFAKLPDVSLTIVAAFAESLLKKKFGL